MNTPGTRTLLVLWILLLAAAVAQADEPDPGYWRLADILTQFEVWEEAYPEIFTVQNLGRSGQARNIPMAIISDQGPGDEMEPRILLHAALHANEPNGTTAIMHSIETLLTGYGLDPDITDRVDGLEIHYVPILNVDAHLHVFSGAPSWQDWRKTMRDNNGNGEPDFPGDGVDLNRNWDWNWDDYAETDPASQKYKGPHPFSEPEILAVRHFVDTRRPAVVVDYHSPVTISWRNYVFWPWMDTGGGGGLGPDEAVSRSVAELWSGATLNEDGSAYNDIYCFSTLPKGQNWIYANTGSLAYIMEISNQCWWSGAMVDTVGHRVSRGSMALLDRVAKGPGLGGRVTDSSTGLPVMAEVIIQEMHQVGIGPRLTDSTHGTFHRLTENGSYTVTITAPGYGPQVQTMVVDGGWTWWEAQLQPMASGVAPDEGASWLVGRHALGSGEMVRLEIPTGVGLARAELFDVRGRRLGVLGDGLVAGAHELRLPRGLAGGVYLLRLQAGVVGRTERLVVVP